MFFAYFFAAIFLFIGVIHLFLGISNTEIGFIISGSVCTAIGLAILILCIIRSIRKEMHPELFKDTDAPAETEEEEEPGEEEDPFPVREADLKGKGIDLHFLTYLFIPGLFYWPIIAGIITKDPAMLLIGSIFLVIGLAITYSMLRPVLQNKRIRKTGRKVWALITEIRVGSWNRSTGRYSVDLTCEAEGRTFRFKAAAHDPKSLDGRTVPVYISGKDPSKYFVDSSGIR